MQALLSMLEQNVFTPFAHSFSSNVYVAGVVMILLNVGTSYLMQDLAPLAHRVFSFVWVRRLVFFAIFFTATRNLLVSIVLTVVFTLLVDVFLNESSAYCLIPYEFRTGTTTNNAITSPPHGEEGQTQPNTQNANQNANQDANHSADVNSVEHFGETNPTPPADVSRRDRFLANAQRLTWAGERGVRF